MNLFSLLNQLINQFNSTSFNLILRFQFDFQSFTIRQLVSNWFTICTDIFTKIYITYIDVLFHLSMLIFCCHDSTSPKQLVATSKWRPPLYKNIASYCFLELIKVQPPSNLGVHRFVWYVSKNICHDSQLSNLLLVFLQYLRRRDRDPAQGTCGIQLWFISMTQAFPLLSS